MQTKQVRRPYGRIRLKTLFVLLSITSLMTLFAGCIQTLPVSGDHATAVDVDSSASRAAPEFGVAVNTMGENVGKVIYVFPRSPAAEAGIQVGDTILAVNDISMETTRDGSSEGINLIWTAIDHAAESGQPLTVTVRRGGAGTTEAQAVETVQGVPRVPPPNSVREGDPTPPSDYNAFRDFVF